MERSFYLNLAARGLRMPVGTDLVLHEEADPESARNHGPALGRVIERAARRWNTPLAIPLMDLRLEKTDLLALAGVAEADSEAYHFTAPLDEDLLEKLCSSEPVAGCPGSQARDEALDYIGTCAGLVAVGMAIGPFSLTTRLMKDPITAVALAGSGIAPDDSNDVQMLWQCLEVAEAAVHRAVRSQIAHGAKAVMICEPAACKAFLSPRQLETAPELFDRTVMGPNLRLKAMLDEAGCDLIFHNCGELIDMMVEAFARRLHPVMLSLGGSRKLWEDARLVPGDVVMFGNLPTKSFYSDAAMPVEEVERRSEELITKMKACGHPYILGSECDVLFVPEAKDAILKKVDAMMAVAAKS